MLQKFPKVLINAQVILHLLHCTFNPFSICSCPGRMGLHRSLHRQDPHLASKIGSHWQRLKARESKGQRTHSPSRPCPPHSHGSHRPFSTMPAFCSGNSWKIKGFSLLLFPGASPPLVCYLTSIVSSFAASRTVPAGTVPEVANNTKSGYSKTVHYLKKPN